MKRDDLKPGDEVLVSQDRDWVKYGRGKRYLIVDTGRWDEPYGSYYYRNTSTPKPTIIYRGVETEVSAHPTREGMTSRHILAREWDESRQQYRHIRAVPLMSIKSPWDEGKAAIAEHQRLRHEANAREDRERHEARARMSVILGALKERGVWVGGIRASTSTKHLRLDLEELEQLLGIMPPD